jgi:RNA polymerase sigma-70 factor, ECF subfamily
VGVRSYADLRSQQEDDAFALLVHRQSRFVFRVAYAMLRNSHDAEDVVQETFLSLYRSGAWRKINDERAFLARATWRQAIDRLRASPRRAVMNNIGEDSDILLEIASRDQDPEQTLLAADQQAAVHRLIDALPEDLRQPLALSAIQELNSREIAAILDIPEGTVRTRLMRARQILKQKLAAQIEVRYAN